MPDAFEFQPTLEGATIVVRPLRADDVESVFAAASDPLIWEQHPDPLRYRRDVFEARYFSGAVASGSAFVVIDRASKEVVGSTRYYDWKPEARSLAIGYTFLKRSHWGGATNRELKHLMLTHAFRWADVVWFHIGAANARSRRAIEKIGARFSHRQVDELNGQSHDYAYYRIDAADYARVHRR